ncbi:PE family protein, partial [Mycobacterium sp.]|uniref:PE family protein n=1 Tax=Mycobacterium sp. TaxID=1785 RepID=UPI002C65E342
MSFLTTVPQVITNAANDLASLGSTISEANAAASGATTGLLPAAADEVSEAIAALFTGHGQTYQALGAEVAQFHDQFVQLMSGSALQYATAEAANASPLQGLGAAIVKQDPLWRLEKAELGVEGGLVSRETALNQALVSGEAGLEGALGANTALGGAVNRGFNVFNLGLGTGEQGFNNVVGAQMPAGFTSQLLLGNSGLPFNSGKIGGLEGIVDQGLRAGTDAAGLTTDNAVLRRFLAGVTVNPVGGFESRLESAELTFNDGLVGREVAFNNSLLSGEVGLEEQIFHTDSALNGVPNRLFNVFNTGLGTAEQGFNGMLGAE